MSRIVSKFGGTSMGDALCMSRSAKVCVRRNSSVVVVSATSGTTNDLIKLGELSENGNQTEAEALAKSIQTKHLKIATDLALPSEPLSELKVLLSEMESIARGIYLLRDCSAKAKDVLLSLGERLSSVLFAQALQTAWPQKKVKLLDVRSVLKTDETFGKARPLTTEISKLCEKKLGNLKDGKVVYVTQGFIGQTLAGATTTLGRGGSDYSAAILAEGIKADTLEIWTDVAGVSTTDPRLCKDAVVIDEISFKEMSELATFGAKVLHPATLLPAIRQNIPVLVASSFEADKPGTWVRREVKNSPLIRALALRKKQTLITLSTPEMLQAHGFLFQLFKIFNDHKISIDAITTSEISVSVTIDSSETISPQLMTELSQVAEVQIEKDLGLVSLIGNNINHTPGLAKRIFEAISEINVRMICYGASRHNFCFLVDEGHASHVIQKLHQKFITGV
ncbi:MAG: lysine-sensitive aspartokinase 3 [Bdellovibrio sp.]|nr:lysine-sensitive aspartokinase 3 [Bdellovibrio sp.]